jgi:MFS superfamily sulfate permease-like transporter
MAAAFIGWFCGIAGLGLMAGSSSKITLLRGVQEQWHLVLPGLIVGLVMYSVVRQVRHVATLPIFIAVEIVIFYAILYLTGTSVADATEAGWIRPTMVDDNAPKPSWTHTWDYLRFDLVDWRAYPQLAMTEIGMIFVVALSSSLDVAAIELELKHQPLDYNHELQTVGWSNIVSGLTGGYTGSYIFSQSIFSLRAGIRSRVAGFALAGCQILVVLAPFPILAYVPNFFFGSLLSMICIDLMYEWLWDVRTRLSKTEYLVCLATFILIQLLSVEYGILAGVALHQVCQRLGWLPTMMMMTMRHNGNNNVKRSQYDINDFEPDNDDELHHQEHAHLLPDHGNNLPRYDSLATSVDTNDDLCLF